MTFYNSFATYAPNGRLTANTMYVCPAIHNMLLSCEYLVNINLNYKSAILFSAEPEDYHVYFDLDIETGVVNKTRRMNASESDRYVLFVKVCVV